MKLIESLTLRSDLKVIFNEVGKIHDLLLPNRHPLLQDFQCIRNNI